MVLQRPTFTASLMSFTLQPVFLGQQAEFISSIIAKEQNGNFVGLVHLVVGSNVNGAGVPDLVSSQAMQISAFPLQSLVSVAPSTLRR